MRSRFAVIAALGLGCGSTAPHTAPPPTPPSAPIAAAPMPMPVAPEPTTAPAADPLTPLDPDIKLGHLANGMTYYVMAHHKPEQRASLWLAVNAGSVLEDDDQRGLAHFCEHMAFNGTKRFPKMDIVNYIEKVGMRFGADVNAYTSFDQTVYMLTVPTDDHGVMMKGLDILRDWAGDVSFDPVEVDKERGVVLEEWRLGRGAFARINDKLFPTLFAGSKYGERLPIGKPEIIKTAARDTLYRFYKDWYRPDQMAVIAIGDFDAAAMETEIKTRFGDLTNPTNERQRLAVPVPHDQPTAVSIATDPEMPFSSVVIYDKLDHRRQTTKGDYRRHLVEGLYHSILRARFAELAEDPAAPFTFAGSYTSSFARTSDLFVRQAQVKAGHAAAALTALYREIARVEKFGFLPSEVERARQDVLSHAETDAKEWAKTPNPEIADEVTRHFFAQEQMGGRALELAYTRELLPTITLAELDHLATTWGGDAGRVIALEGPASQAVPSEADIRQLAATAATAPIEAWQDTGAARPLLAHAPTPGKIVATVHDAATDSTIWTLSNGIRVIVKPTTFQNDEVKLVGWQPGGTSLLSDADWDQIRFGGAVTAMGVGDLDATTLKKVLAGKVAEMSVGYDELAETARGSARPQDLETMFQLLYLRITAPRKDARAFDAWKQSQREWLGHKDLLPEMQFFEQREAIASSKHHRRMPETAAQLDKVELDRVLAIYQDRFRDVGHFTFVLVGNLDPTALQPLVETYLGSLPASGRTEHWKNIGVKPPTRTLQTTITAGTEPKSYVALEMTAPMKWTLDGERDAKILSMVLGIRLREVLREDMGGVYGVSVQAGLAREPVARRTFDVFFGCDPANIDKLKAAVFAEVGKIMKSGVTDEYLDKVREQLRRKHETDLKDNDWWLGRLRDTFYFGDDFTATTDVGAIEQRVTSANVKAAANRFFTPGNYVLTVMKPKAIATTRHTAAPP